MKIYKNMKTFRLRDFFYYNIKLMKYVGLWSETGYSSNFYLVYAVILNGFFCLITCIAMAVYIMTSKSFLENTLDVANCLLMTLTFIKSLFIMKYNYVFQRVVDMEVHRSFSVDLTANQNKTLSSYLGFWKNLNRVCSYISVLNVINYTTLTPLMNNVAYSLPLNGWYPFDYKKPVVYELIYLHQCISLCVAIPININGATLIAGFLAYLAAECDVLIDMLRNLNVTGDNMADKAKLKKCIKYHTKIVEYARSIELFLSKYLIFLFASSCLTTAFIMTSLTMHSNSKADYTLLCIVQLAVFAHLYIYCWYGNEVTAKSMKIPYAVFETNWIIASKEFKSTLLFFMFRTQKPIKLYAVNFFELSLRTFIEILRSAWSYYALLSQFSMDE